MKESGDDSQVFANVAGYFLVDTVPQKYWHQFRKAVIAQLS